MSYFIFNGIRSDDMKLYVEHLPPIIKPPERYDVIRVSGNSVIKFNEQGYDIYEKNITIGFNESDISEIINWLRGKGKLIFSNELDKYYDVYIPAQIDYEKALKFRKATITFLTQPYKHSSEVEETTSRIVINQGNTDCLPLMTVYGSGWVDIKINNIKACSVNIDEFITLDGEEQEAYKASVMQNRSMIGDFPKLSPGENEITFTGNVTSVNTIVRSRWL